MNKVKPELMEGIMYFVERFNIKEEVDLEAELIDLQIIEHCQLSSGIVIPNGENKRIKFDINLGENIFGCFYDGFLYDDSKFNGNIKYIVDANTKPSNFQGQYKITEDNEIILRGVWERHDGVKEYIWIELFK